MRFCFAFPGGRDNSPGGYAAAETSERDHVLLTERTEKRTEK